MSDIGQMTHSIKSQAEDLGLAWRSRASEFGPREITDVYETIVALGRIIREMNARKEAA